MQDSHLHIIGICGTFMGGVARLAQNMGFHVSGSDANTYPPMSTQLESLGITLYEGFRAGNVPANTDVVIVGNAISRGNPELEYVLDNNIPYTSGAQWLGENVLQGRWVLAVAGTHGKTTTSSLLAWLLQDNDLAPGYLIGGVPENFGESARLGDTPFFVIEADEYDTAFCDKRSKFVHYRAKTLVLNNLEFDHADIFSDLAAIQTQFHHLVRTIPGHGQIIHNAEIEAIDEVLAMGCWSETQCFTTDQKLDNADWRVEKVTADASEFVVLHKGQRYAAHWDLIGDHNMQNALAAIAAAHHVGVQVKDAVRSISSFRSVKRRMELIFDDTVFGKKVRIFDDFAHHPTAIEHAINGLRKRCGQQSLIAVLEPRSNTMKQGVHKHLLADALSAADSTLIYADNKVNWDIKRLEDEQLTTFGDVESLLDILVTKIEHANDDCNVLIMSNGGFEGLYTKLIDKLS